MSAIRTICGDSRRTRAAIAGAVLACGAAVSASDSAQAATPLILITRAWSVPAEFKPGQPIDFFAEVTGPADYVEVLTGETVIATLTDPDHDHTYTGRYDPAKPPDVPAAMPLAGKAASPAEKAALAPPPRSTTKSTGAAFVTLSNGSGEGSLNMNVDAYGSFGSAAGVGGETLYDPVGPVAASSAVFYSALYFSPALGYLRSDTPATVTLNAPNTASSSFKTSGFDITLTQTLSAIGRGGSTLTQTYHITNRTASKQDLVLVRHVDGDLLFDGTLSDAGGASADGLTLFEFDSGDDPRRLTTYVGIQLKGSGAQDFTVQSYEFASAIVDANGIPANARGIVQNDTNNDHVIDVPYDVTMSLQRNLSLAAGASADVTTRTIFGQGSIDQVFSQTSGFTMQAIQEVNGVPVIRARWPTLTILPAPPSN